MNSFAKPKFTDREMEDYKAICRPVRGLDYALDVVLAVGTGLVLNGLVSLVGDTEPLMNYIFEFSAGGFLAISAGLMRGVSAQTKSFYHPKNKHYGERIGPEKRERIEREKSIHTL